MTFDRPFVVIGNPEGLRLRLLSEALAELGLPPARTISYADLLTGRANFGQVPPRAIVRLESPGKDFDVEKLLLARGASEAEAEGSPVIVSSHALNLEFDRGRIWHPRQWYLGFRSALRSWHEELRTRDDVLLTAWPPDIESLFDKSRCHVQCREADIPVAETIDPVTGYDDLVSQMQDHRWERVFLKLAHGSSASGAVALQRHRGRATAHTTVEIAGAAAEPRLYNTRPVRTVTDEDEIRRTVDALAPHRLHAQKWLPKASLNSGVFDLRIVLIAGRPRHTVVRTGKSPITNLQLGNRRGSLDEFDRRIPEDQQQALRKTCRQIAALYPRSLHLGLDLLFTPGFKDHFLLEVNAFGDLLPSLLDDDQSTYAAELAELIAGWPDRNVPPPISTPANDAPAGWNREHGPQRR